MGGLTEPPKTPLPRDQPTTSKSAPPSDCFQFATEESLHELAKGYTPANTSSSTKWALRDFEQWREARNWQHPSDPVPKDLLTSCNPDLLNTTLQGLL